MLPSLIYSCAGSPPMEGATPGICRTCGTAAVGLPWNAWVRDTFTDQDKLTGGTICCHACQFCFTDRNEILTRRTGKPKPQRMRNYSHFIVDGQWIALSKGDKRTMRDLLARQPEAAILAVSGQKHIIFRARPGWWQFEEQRLRPFPAELERLLPVVEQLYDGGFAKTDIESGRYPQHRILRFGVPAWQTAEASIRPLRGTARLELALFLAQREEKDDGDDTPADR